jgi:hypothetical protein
MFRCFSQSADWVPHTPEVPAQHREKGVFASKWPLVATTSTTHTSTGTSASESVSSSAPTVPAVAATAVTEVLWTLVNRSGAGVPPSLAYTSSSAPVAPVAPAYVLEVAWSEFPNHRFYDCYAGVQLWPTAGTAAPAGSHTLPTVGSIRSRTTAGDDSAPRYYGATADSTQGNSTIQLAFDVEDYGYGCVFATNATEPQPFKNSHLGGFLAEMRNMTRDKPLAGYANTWR